MRNFLIIVFSVILMFTSSTIKADGNLKQEITHAEAKLLGEELAFAMNARYYKRLNELFNIEHFSERAARTISDKPKDIKLFKKGFLEGLSQHKKGLFTGILSNPNAEISFIRVKDKNKPIVRMYNSQGGAGYFYFSLKRIDGEPIAVDLFTYANNRYFSDQIGKLTKLMMSPSESLLKKIFGQEKIDKSILGKFRKITQLKLNNQPLAALKVIESLPEKIRTNEFILLMALELAPVEDPRYEELTNTYIDVVSEEKVANTMLIDYYFFKNDFAKAEKAIIGLEKQIGGSDDYTSVLKANVALYDENYAKVIELVNNAIEDGHVNEDLNWAKLNAYVLTNDFSNAIKEVQGLERTFDYAFTPADFSEDDIWLNFSKSNEFQTFFKEQ